MTIARPWFLDAKGLISTPPTDTGGGGGTGTGGGGQTPHPPHPPKPPKGGGGNGNGGGAGWTGGKGWGKGGKKNGGGTDFGTFTDQPEYWFSATKTTAGSGSNTAVTSWTGKDGTDSADFDLATGVWTCPATGYYLIEPRSYNQTVYTVPFALSLRINGSEVTASSEQTSGGQNHGLSNSTVHMAYLTAGQTITVYQVNDALLQAQLNIIGLHTNYLFQATGGAGSGDSSAAWLDTTGWSAASLEFSTNWSGCFDETTGDFTCPVNGAGRWVFYTRGRNSTVSNTNHYAGIFHNSTQVSQSKNYCSATTAYSDNPMLVVLDLADGDVVNLRQHTCVLSNCVFGGFRLKDTTPAWCAYEPGAAGTGISTDFQNYANEFVDTDNAFDTVGGDFTAPVAGNYFAYHSAITNTLAQANASSTFNKFNGAYPGRPVAIYAESASRHQRTSAGGDVAPLGSGQTVVLWQNAVEMATATFCGFRVVGNNST